jgi:hypothetical protein
LAGAITLAMLAFGAGPASANEYGNPDFLGIVKASPPQGFPVSPAFIDLTSGPAALTFSVQATNLTSSDQSTPIEFSLHHILTFQGQDVSDGQPGQPGISFPAGNVNLVTEELSGSRQTALLKVPANGQGTVSYPVVMSSCGYFEIDFSTPHTPYTYLAVGFTRALGCTSSVTTTTLRSTTTTTASVLASTTTSAPATTSTTAGSQVLATEVSTTSAGRLLPVTGSDSRVLVGMAGLLLLVGGACMVAANRRPRRRPKQT